MDQSKIFSFVFIIAIIIVWQLYKKDQIQKDNLSTYKIDFKEINKHIIKKDTNHVDEKIFYVQYCSPGMYYRKKYQKAVINFVKKNMQYSTFTWNDIKYTTTDIEEISYNGIGYLLGKYSSLKLYAKAVTPMNVFYGNQNNFNGGTNYYTDNSENHFEIFNKYYPDFINSEKVSFEDKKFIESIIDKINNGTSSSVDEQNLFDRINKYAPTISAASALLSVLTNILPNIKF